MGRLPRVYIEGSLYYVTSQTGHAYNIFLDDMDYREYISLVAKYKDQYGFKLFSYSLLPARLEMLIELKNNVPISNIMHDINSLYTKLYNSKYGKKGHLFQQRFKSIIAEKEMYLLRLVRQIHLSPVVDKLTTDPKAYQYSSHNLFLDPAKREFPNMKDEVEEIFKVLKGREEAFEKYVSDPNPMEIEGLKKTLRRKRILGSDDFAESVRNRIEENARLQEKNRLTRKNQILYISVGGAAILVLAIGITYFYLQNTTLKSEYAETVDMYKKTLDMLKKERETAVKANKSAEDYAWKIRLTEQALEKTIQARERSDYLKKDMDGSMWRIELTQVSGSPVNVQKDDVIYFKNNFYFSNNLNNAGFPSSAYTKTDLKNGIIVWRTSQSNERGEIAAWRGEWDGDAMKGTMSFRSIDGEARDFSFISMGRVVKK
ncbi:MAG: transposase [Candidatus Omnitrophota bacterium]